MRSFTLLAFFALAACSREPFGAPMKLGGKLVPAETLNKGRVAYMQYCRPCHGDQGDGKGPASIGLRPPPRNFKQGEFKFAGVRDQKLPRDEDLVRIVRSPLHGTAMLGWDVPDEKLDEILQYIKTLSPKWKRSNAVGQPIVPPPDPWGDSRAVEAAARGKKLYHGLAMCQNCHPAYATRPEIWAASKELLGKGFTDLRADTYLPELKDSDYGTKVLPPDFTFHELRSIQPGTELQDLYRILVAGVTGAAMPSWSPEALPEKEKDVYAVAYFVRSLMRLRGMPAAEDLHDRLERQPPFTPPQ